MKIANTIQITDENYYPMEIYLDSKYLVVIGSAARNIPMPKMDYGEGSSSSAGSAEDPDLLAPDAQDLPIPEDQALPTPEDPDLTTPEGQDLPTLEDKPAKMVDPGFYYNSQGTIRVYIYNIEQPENASLVREFEMDGSYVSSRKVGSQLYMLSNQYLYYYAQDINEENAVPYYRDSVINKDFVPVDYSRIHYFPDTQDSNYLMIAGLNLDKMDEQVNVTTYLGSGQTIYASTENLYVAVSKWEYLDQPIDNQGVIEPDMPANAPDMPVAEPAEEVKPPDATTSIEVDPVKGDIAVDLPLADDMISIMPIIPEQQANVSTLFYKFSLNEGNVTYAAKGEVPGSLLNQFSMDEHNGFFRVATTTGQMWWGSESTSKNNLYILDSSLNITGRIENIAPGERIYSVRFMGDKGYMVTFKNMDPLFVMDLKDPSNPKILGELKIPGYSDYLHPYDENHIIGFGMDTKEVEVKDENGKVVGTTTYQLGMKVAMFDVSDINNPIEKFKVNIGDSGTYSDVLYNHKALLFNREKNILAFPVSVQEAKEQWIDQEKTIPNYGTFAFQGLYVFSIDMASGFNLEAKISHLTPEEVQKAQSQGYEYEKTVERALYIDDTLYTISKAFIKAHDMDSYQEKATLALPYIKY